MNIRHPKESDHSRIIGVMKDWWNGRDLTHALPRLFLSHFKTTSFIAEKNTRLAGFLIGFFSQDHSHMGYIHFAGVDPEFQGKGLGEKLYHLFFECCKNEHRTHIRSCTSPVNKGSIAFHQALGFEILYSEHMIDGVPVFPDYNRPGDAKVMFEKKLKTFGRQKIRIQQAGADDISTLSRLIRLSYKDVAKTFNLTEKNCPRHPSNCTDDWIKEDMARGVTYYILYYGQTPAGCAALEAAEKNVSYLERLCILPEFRHQQLGRSLVGQMLSLAGNAGSKTVSIGIIAEQAILRKWYESLGFSYIKTKRYDHLPFQVGFMKTAV